MPDIRTLLHEAAPTPLVALDMAAVRARAHRGTMRRFFTLLLGAGVVAGLGVPVGNRVFAPASPGEHVATVGRKGVEGSTTPGPTASSEVGASSASLPSRPAAAPTQRPTSATPTTQRTGSATPSPARGYAPAAECTVNDAALPEGATRTCGFIATRQGGASFESDGATTPAKGVSPTGKVKVTRNGQTSVHQVDRFRATAGDGGVFVGCNFFIEPGDLVEVVITASAAGAKDTFTVTLGAGEHWAC